VSLSGKKYMLWVLLAVCLSTLFYTVHSYYQLQRQYNDLSVELQNEKHKFKVLQSKYAEQKSQAATLQRLNIGLEGNMRKSQQELESVKVDNESLQKEISGMEEKCNHKVASLEERVSRCTEQIEKLVENRDQYKDKLEETVKIVKERNEMIYKLSAENEELKSGLQVTTSTLKRCEKHNSRLSKLAEELVVAYENKGIGASLIQSEPFTQIKKVELEKLIQQYRDRIDNDNLELINPQKK
jgi:chromosome segregation ATPase